MPPFAAVIFDNDGLLLDTEEAWTRAEETLFARRGRVWTMEHKRDLIGSSGAVAAAKLERMLDVPGEGVALMDELDGLVMKEVLLHGVAPRPGATELLAALGAAGVSRWAWRRTPRGRSWSASSAVRDCSGTPPRSASW